MSDEAVLMENGLVMAGKLLVRLQDAKRDAREWKEQHENLLIIYRASVERAASLQAEVDSMNRLRVEALRERDAMEDQVEKWKAIAHERLLRYITAENREQKLCDVCAALSDAVKSMESALKLTDEQIDEFAEYYFGPEFLGDRGILLALCAQAKSANRRPIQAWYCGCGHTNGINLATCAACGRGPSGEQRGKPVAA